MNVKQQVAQIPQEVKSEWDKYFPADKEYKFPLKDALAVVGQVIEKHGRTANFEPCPNSEALRCQFNCRKVDWKTVDFNELSDDQREIPLIKTAMRLCNSEGLGNLFLELLATPVEQINA